MKFKFSLFAFLVIVLISCNKGKVMPETVYASIDTSSTSVYITTGIDPTYQIPYQYTNTTSALSLVSGTTSKLKKYLAKK